MTDCDSNISCFNLEDNKCKNIYLVLGHGSTIINDAPIKIPSVSDKGYLNIMTTSQVGDVWHSSKSDVYLSYMFNNGKKYNKILNLLSSSKFGNSTFLGMNLKQHTNGCTISDFQ